MAVDFGLTNVDGFGKAMELLRQEFVGLSQEGAQEWCQTTLEDARRRCPRKTGKLASTAKLVVSKQKRTDLHVIKISFGVKKLAPYGAIVHFDPTLKHDNGEVRYLYNAVTENRKDVPQVIGSKLRAKGGGKKK